MRSLLVYKLDGSTEVLEMAKPLLRIGRGDDNDVVLPDPLRRVSRFHAQISCENSGPPVINDLRSANGTFVNDRLVSEPVRLQPDDLIRVGPYRLCYRDGTARTQRESDPNHTSRFKIETAGVELNELQARSGLIDLAPGAGAQNTVEFRTLELLHEVGVRLARSATEAEVVETSIDLLFKIEGVHRATMMLWEEDKQAFRGADLYTRGGKETMGAQPSVDPRNVVMSKTILAKVRRENRPLHIRDTRSESDLSLAMSIVRAGIQAAFCSPLTFQGSFLGVLYADNLMAPDAFSPADFRTFTTIAAQAGLALASTIARSELIRREVERSAMRLYLSPQVADLIAASDGAIQLGGVLQPLTVLFADIRGFTALSEKLAAPDVVLLLNEFFTAITRVILDSGGTLDKYIGDCVMALFGAPLPAEDDVERALAAAAAMQREVVKLNWSRRQREVPEIRIGVGIHTGLAVVGNIGSEQRMQYTAIGDTVNVAARLVSRAAAGQVIVSESVRAVAADRDRFQYLAEVELKGREQKLNIYSVPWDDLCNKTVAWR
jgi:adenylate cyclase